MTKIKIILCDDDGKNAETRQFSIPDDASDDEIVPFAECIKAWLIHKMWKMDWEITNE